MHIAVLNYSGNVGKSTIARHLLSPRLGHCPVFFVESINAGGDKATNVKGRDLRDVLVDMAVLNDAVVDIGSSNIEQAVSQLKNMANSHEDFDFFVIPTVPVKKQQQDTFEICQDLMGLGIKPAKIRLVLNQVPLDVETKKVFQLLMDLLADFDFDFETVLHLNDVYPLLGNMTIDRAIADHMDFKAKIAATNDVNLKRELATALGISRLAKTAKRELDAAFESMFGLALAHG